MPPSRHIAVCLYTNDPDLEHQVVFWVEACRVQMLEHVAPAWADWADPPGVYYYSASDGPPGDDALGIVGIFSDAGGGEAAGFHSAVGSLVLGAVDLGRSRNPSVTLSHEIAEMWRNPYLDEWLPGPTRGRELAVEISDPVQRVTYQVPAVILGERRLVEVGDFVTPAWFGMGEGPRTHCRAVDQPWQIATGGYQIAREDRTSILYLTGPGGVLAQNTITRPLSRTSLISQGITIPRPRWAA